jgi:hypothetical protein
MAPLSAQTTVTTCSSLTVVVGANICYLPDAGADVLADIALNITDQGLVVAVVQNENLVKIVNDQNPAFSSSVFSWTVPARKRADDLSGPRPAHAGRGRARHDRRTPVRPPGCSRRAGGLRSFFASQQPRLPGLFRCPKAHLLGRESFPVGVQFLAGPAVDAPRPFSCWSPAARRRKVCIRRGTLPSSRV